MGQKGGLGGRFDIFYFFLLGEAEGSPRRWEGGGGFDFLLKIPGGGGFWRRGGAEGPRVFAANLGIGGGGLDIFFRGRNVLQGVKQR